MPSLATLWSETYFAPSFTPSDVAISGSQFAIEVTPENPQWVRVGWASAFVQTTIGLMRVDSRSLYSGLQYVDLSSFDSIDLLRIAYRPYLTKGSLKIFTPI